MKIIVERVVGLGPVKKEQIASFEADLLPVSVGDDLWIVGDGGCRERHIAHSIRMMIDRDGVTAIIDVAKVSVASVTAKSLKLALGDKEDMGTTGS